MLSVFTGVAGAILALFWIVFLGMAMSNPHMKRELWGPFKGLLYATAFELLLVVACVTLQNNGFNV